MIVYISIGNSDDKLTQRQWHSFYVEVAVAVLGFESITVHGQWVSEPASAYQNACWCVEFSDQKLDAWVVAEMRFALESLAVKYEQDSIAWAEAPVTEFLTATVTE